MRVLISGYYGFGNLGDEALLSGLVAGLQARGHDVRVLSGDPASTRGLHGVPSAGRYGGLLPALLDADALVSGGGGLLQDVTSRRSLRYYLGVLRLGRLLGKRVCVYGQSVGPLGAVGRRRVAGVLRGLPVAVRDGASRTLLGELGIEAALVADPALLLHCPPASVRTGPGAPRPPVLLVPRNGHPDLNEALAAAGRRLLDRGLAVAVMGLHEREDGPEVARLARALAVEVRPAATPQEALRRAGESRYVLSVRLHGLILAAACGVGFAGLPYDPKVAGFLQDARAPLFERPLDPAELARVAEAAAPPDGEALAALKRRAGDGLDWLQRRLVEQHTLG